MKGLYLIMKHDENKMWHAVVDCDKKYNGDFLYAVKTVGVYCRPSCKSRTPLRKNVIFFETTEKAKNAGFRPCKRCHPDLFEYDPNAELASLTKKLIDKYFQEKEELTKQMKQLGVSSNYLAVIFKQQFGIPPMAHFNSKRIEYAKKQLTQTNITIIDIASDIGVESLSAFYRFFKKHTGITPKEYRKESF